MSSAIPIDSKGTIDTSELIETSLPNFFTSLSPAQGLLLPIFPPVDHFVEVKEDETPEITARLSVTTRKPGTPHHIIDADNIVRSEFINGIHKITSDRQSFEFKVLQTGDESDVILTENAIVSGLPTKDGSNFLIAFPVEPNPSLVAATVSATPDAFVTVGEKSLSQVLSDRSPKLAELFTLPQTSLSLFHDELTDASALYALPATALLTPFVPTN